MFSEMANLVQPEAVVSGKFAKQQNQIKFLCGQCSQWFDLQYIMDICPKCGPICAACDEEHKWVVWFKKKGVKGEAE